MAASFSPTVPVSTRSTGDDLKRAHGRPVRQRERVDRLDRPAAPALTNVCSTQRPHGQPDQRRRASARHGGRCGHRRRSGTSDLRPASIACLLLVAMQCPAEPCGRLSHSSAARANTPLGQIAEGDQALGRRAGAWRRVERQLDAVGQGGRESTAPPARQGRGRRRGRLRPGAGTVRPASHAGGSRRASGRRPAARRPAAQAIHGATASYRAARGRRRWAAAAVAAGRKTGPPAGSARPPRPVRRWPMRVRPRLIDYDIY